MPHHSLSEPLEVAPAREGASELLQPRRILVRGVNWLGDAVMTTPALLRLRERFPDALIALLTPQKLQGIWLHHPAIDELITFKSDDSVTKVASKIRVVMWPETPGKPAEGEQPATGKRRKVTFDLAVVLPNSPRAALEVWLARIPHRIGYARPWRNLFLTLRVPPRPDAVRMHKRSIPDIKRLIADPAATRVAPDISAHQVHDYLQLVAELGANPEPLPTQLLIKPGEVKAVAQEFNLGNEFTNERPLFGLNAGAEYGPAKRWPAERFIAAACEIQKRTPCTWLILGGKGEVELARRIEAGIGGSGSTVRNLAGQTSLRELCGVLKLCRVLLTNDTGPMHVAAALGTPVVVPFGSTSPELTGPTFNGDPRHRLLVSDAPCSPCFRRECPIDFRCMNGISVESVVRAVLEATSLRSG